MQDPSETGPIDGAPPEPPAGETHPMGTDQEYAMAGQLAELQAEVRNLTATINRQVRERQNLERCIQYLASLATNDWDQFIPGEFGAEDELATVLIQDPIDPDRFTRTTFTNTGTVALAAAAIEDTAQEVQNLRTQLAIEQADDGPVDASILPAWAADMDNFHNVAMVSSQVGKDPQLLIQRREPLSTPEAMLAAAWLYVMAGLSLDDPETGFDYLVEQVQGT